MAPIAKNLSCARDALNGSKSFLKTLLEVPLVVELALELVVPHEEECDDSRSSRRLMFLDDDHVCQEVLVDDARGFVKSLTSLHIVSHAQELPFVPRGWRP